MASMAQTPIRQGAQMFDRPAEIEQLDQLAPSEPTAYTERAMGAGARKVNASAWSQNSKPANPANTAVRGRRRRFAEWSTGRLGRGDSSKNAAGPDGSRIW